MENRGRERALLKLVSVIVPVYNSEKYMDQCLDSICGQTFQNLEILLVYDKSEDHTLEKCEEWQKKDGRIRIIRNESRKGLGAARNCGLANARGEYIVYADSDDWMEKSYLGILYDEMEKEQADFVSSNAIYIVSEEDGEKKLHTSSLAGFYHTEALKRVLLLCDFPSVWKKMIRRKWLIEQKLYQPEIYSYEDWGYAPVLILHAAKIVLLAEPGCYYRKSQNCLSSTMSQQKLWEDFIRTCRFFIDRCKRENCFAENADLLRRYILAEFDSREKIAEYGNQAVAQKIRDFERDIFIRQMRFDVRLNRKNAVVFGSFSARWEAQASKLFQERLDHFCFSSLICAMGQTDREYAVCHPNAFRKCQVERDLTGELRNRIGNIREPVYFFLDFMEERHGVVAYEDGSYATCSDAFAETGIRQKGRKIEMGSEEFWEIWKNKCDILIDALRKNPNIQAVILLKNRLCSQVGDLRGTQVNGAAEAVRINGFIEKMENYFLRNCGEAESVGIPDDMQFTDKAFGYGVHPQYMNQAAYVTAGLEIFKRCRTVI